MPIHKDSAHRPVRYRKAAFTGGLLKRAVLYARVSTDAPVQAVTEIRYIDVAGDVQVLPTSTYVITGIVDVGRISLAQGQSWPAVRWHDEAVTIDFVAGYGDHWNAVPEPIRAGIGEAVRALFDGCGPALPAEMLVPYRVWPV
jgi:uncharacterized phiE125 gp8 family phage protein